MEKYLAIWLLATVTHARLNPATLYDSEEAKNVESKPRDYSFSYGVKDLHTGDVKDQWEKREGQVVTGHYSVLEPDGSVRSVEYTADKEHGFNAVVKKHDGSVEQQHRPLSYATANRDELNYAYEENDGEASASTYFYKTVVKLPDAQARKSANIPPAKHKDVVNVAVIPASTKLIPIGILQIKPMHINVTERKAPAKLPEEFKPSYQVQSSLLESGFVPIHTSSVRAYHSHVPNAYSTLSDGLQTPPLIADGFYAQHVESRNGKQKRKASGQAKTSLLQRSGGGVKQRKTNNVKYTKVVKDDD